MELLVTGATGYLGGHVVRAALARGHRVRALVRPGTAHEWLEELGVDCRAGDLQDEPSLLAAARGAEGLVHCAARLGYWSRQDDDQRRINVEGTSAMLRAARQRRIARIVHVSSVVAVGATRDRRPLCEDESWPGRDGLELNYVRTKREAEERVFAAAKAGMQVAVVNPGAMLGPRADGRARGGLAAIAIRGPARVAPGGSAFADVEDVALGVLAALERGRAGERYLLGGHDLDWLEVHRRIAGAAGVVPPRGHEPAWKGRLCERAATVLDLAGLSRPRFAPERWRIWGWYTFADCSKARAELGYAPRPFDETVARAVAAERGAASS